MTRIGARWLYTAAGAGFPAFWMSGHWQLREVPDTELWEVRCKGRVEVTCGDLATAKRLAYVLHGLESAAVTA